MTLVLKQLFILLSKCSKY